MPTKLKKKRVHLTSGQTLKMMVWKCILLIRFLQINYVFIYLEESEKIYKNVNYRFKKIRKEKWSGVSFVSWEGDALWPAGVLSSSCLVGGSDSKESACNAGDPSLIPGWGRSPGEGNGNPLQYSCLEYPMDRGAWWATIHGVDKSQTRLNE